MDLKTMTQMDPAVIEAMSKSKEKLSLRKPITLDELFSLMEQDKARFPGNFKLKKGLFGASIVFDMYMNMGAKVKAKGTEVIINRLEQNKNVIRQQGGKNRMQINQMADFVQSTKSVVNSLKTGKSAET